MWGGGGSLRGPLGATSPRARGGEGGGERWPRLRRDDITEVVAAEQSRADGTTTHRATGLLKGSTCAPPPLALGWASKDVLAHRRLRPTRPPRRCARCSCVRGPAARVLGRVERGLRAGRVQHARRGCRGPACGFHAVGSDAARAVERARHRGVRAAPLRGRGVPSRRLHRTWRPHPPCCAHQTRTRGAPHRSSQQRQSGSRAAGRRRGNRGGREEAA